MSERKEVWLSIKYGEFYDIPRAFIVQDKGATYLFDCPFNDATDDYPDEFVVYKLPKDYFGEDAIPWTKLAAQGKRIGSINAKDVVFDETMRVSIRADVMETLANK